MNFVDLKGKCFGTLTVLEYLGQRYKNSEWLCQCDCGKVVKLLSGNLKKQQSCGCLHDNNLAKKRFLHGHSRKRSETCIYKRWQKMKERCLNLKAKAYKNYGGRGITVCEEWLLPNGQGFINFYNWSISYGYLEGLSIERIDVNGNYCPENCSWIPKSDQYKNKQNTKKVMYQGSLVRLAELVKQKGAVEYKLVWGRLKNGWNIDSALLTPNMSRRR